MIKAKVIKAFYCDKDKELYLDKERYDELKMLGLVEKISMLDKNGKEIEIATRNTGAENKKISTSK